MLQFLKNAMNRTYTENGAVTLRTSGSDCLDLFASIGALRAQSDTEIADRFLRLGSYLLLQTAICDLEAASLLPTLSVI